MSNYGPFFVALEAAWPGRYGIGGTVKEAKAEARKAGARKGAKFLVIMAPIGAVDVWVNNMAGIQWTWADWAPDTNAEVRTVEAPSGIKKGK